jgi:hypothetical protein
MRVLTQAELIIRGMRLNMIATKQDALLARLRVGAKVEFSMGSISRDMSEAADLIAKLTKQRDELLAALKHLISTTKPDETGEVCLSDVEASVYEAYGVIAAVEADNA